MRIENWAIVVEEHAFLAPELRQKKLQGKVYGHKNFKDGVHITTSPITKIDLENNIIETTNSTYNLGTPSDGYSKWLNKNGHSLE